MSTTLHTNRNQNICNVRSRFFYPFTPLTPPVCFCRSPILIGKYYLSECVINSTDSRNCFVTVVCFIFSSYRFLFFISLRFDIPYVCLLFLHSCSLAARYSFFFFFFFALSVFHFVLFSIFLLLSHAHTHTHIANIILTMRDITFVLIFTFLTQSSTFAISICTRMLSGIAWHRVRLSVRLFYSLFVAFTHSFLFIFSNFEQFVAYFYFVFFSLLFYFVLVSGRYDCMCIYKYVGLLLVTNLHQSVNAHVL